MKKVCYSGVIAKVYEGGLAEELGIEAGDKILRINGQDLKDIIDLSFAFADEDIELLLERKNGEQEWIEFDKEYDEELGVAFESAVFDGIRRCANRCWFCFVDQIAPNMRQSLSVKDDDYRMSFLYGNFVTLTNLTQADLTRIERLHLSPLFVSVHTTNGDLRAKMLQNKNAGRIMQQLNQLIEIGVDFHTQIVLCPGINDGPVLEQTIRDLAQLQPAALSLAVVPVGLTRHRGKCYPLTKFSKEQAEQVIDQVAKWQRQNRLKTGNSFVYLGDEFYFLAGRPLPQTEEYDGFPQLENGVGLTRNFLNEWENAAVSDVLVYEEPLVLDVVCGKSAGPVLEACFADLAAEGLRVRVVGVENHFFGPDITVSGLLTGQDILNALHTLKSKGDGVILPGAALRTGEDVFLDDMKLGDLERRLGVPVKVAHTGAELKQFLLCWPGQHGKASGAREAYTWQGNAGYNQIKRETGDDIE